ncbi:GNAT family protein [uncultured Polaribacter sp.]|uniref:GNAT family N-acetyltransferase n=1 Tax=uncultured Polaribacter sp. TaxID=174711 RepID=UPI00260C8E48|nr:GNAT family protein [uncultured Polaribacter sp.]
MIEGKNIYLKALEQNDIDFMLTLVNNQELAYWEGKNEFLKTNESQKEWFLKNLSTGYRFIIYEKETNLKLGYFSFKYTNSISKSGLIAIKIIKNSRGKKIGTDSLKTGMSFLFNKININRLHTHIIDYNLASLNLFRKCYWVIEGKERKSIFMNNDYHDNILLSILKEEYYQNEEIFYLDLFKF